MKRFLTTALILSLLGGSAAFAGTASTTSDSAVQKIESAPFSVKKQPALKKLCKHAWKRIKPDEEKPSVSSEEVMTPHKQAVLYYNDGDLTQSFNIILAISENDRTAQDLFLLGNILQDQDKISDAIFMYKRAIVVNEDFYKPYYNLGNIYLEDEKPFMAIENYKKVIKLKDNFSYAFYNLGCAYLQTGNLKKAKLAFIKAIEIKNTEPDFHYNLAYTYKGLNKPKLAKQYLDNYNKLIDAQQNQ